MNFNNIIGNDQIKELLINSINNHNLIHSYMFIGIDGIGKKLFATAFAKMVLCEKGNKPCDYCTSCIRFDSNNHPDFMIIDSLDGKSIKVDQIRLLQEKIAEKPILSDKKVYIINNSDLMTVEAQNCLLKTLEEPPAYATLILVLSNENKMLNTIKSRCTKINFKKLSMDELTKYAMLNNIHVSAHMLNICDGSIAKLNSIKNENDIYNSIDNIISNIYNKDIVDVWNESEVLYKSKDSISSLLDYFNTVFIHELRKTNNKHFVNAIKIVEATKNRLSSNANYDMCIDNLLLKIWEEFHENYNRS